MQVPSSAQPPGQHSMTFGVNLGRDAPSQTAAAARAAEQAGFDVVTAADHWGQHDPLVVLAVAAATTERVRLRSYVLDVGFWQPALLVRAVCTLDALSGGRVELGLGAGHMRHEHEAVGVPFAAHAERVDALEAMIIEIRRRFADPEQAPAAVQAHIPVLVGAMSGAGLDVAARHADIVALSGLLQVPGERAGTFTLASRAQTDERVGRLRALADGQERPLDALLQHVVVDRDPDEVAAEFSTATDGRISADLVLDSPFVLLAATAQEAAAELDRRRARWGITSWCTHAPSGPALARVLGVIRR